IRYTTDGHDPGPNDPGFSSGGSVSISSGVTLKARAFRDGLLPSPVTTATYTLKAARPGFSPPQGPVTNGQLIAIASLTSGATIRFTLDGTDPTGASAIYSSPIPYSQSATIKARAFKTGFDDSAVAVFSPSTLPIQNFVSAQAGINNSFDCPALSGWVYHLQVAENPSQWRDFGRAQPGTNSTLHFRNDNVYPTTARRLFRIRAEPDLG